MFPKLLLSLLALASPVFAQTIKASARAECLIPVILAPGSRRAEITLPVDRCETLQVATAFESDQVQVQFVRPDGSVLPWRSDTAGLAFDLSEQSGEAEDDPANQVYPAAVDDPAWASGSCCWNGPNRRGPEPGRWSTPGPFTETSRIIATP